jgi:hypothetical protein
MRDTTSITKPDDASVSRVTKAVFICCKSTTRPLAIRCDSHPQSLQPRVTM